MGATLTAARIGIIARVLDGGRRQSDEGQHCFGAEAKPNDLTIIRKNGEWFASVTLRVPETTCARERTDHQHRGVDLTDWATFDNGETIAKPLARQRAKSKSVTRETPATTSQDV